MAIALLKKRDIPNDDLVVIPRKEYEALRAGQIPSVFLKGKVARRLDARVSAARRWFAKHADTEAGIAEGLEDIRHGRFYGPFDTATEAVASLKRNLAKGVSRRISRK